MLTLQRRPLRLVKEASYYEKETKENEATLKKMKDDNRGEHPGDYAEVSRGHLWAGYYAGLRTPPHMFTVDIM